MKNKPKRKRITRVGTHKRIPAIVELAKELNVGYNEALNVYNRAKAYSKVFKTESLLDTIINKNYC